MKASRKSNLMKRLEIMKTCKIVSKKNCFTSLIDILSNESIQVMCEAIHNIISQSTTQPIFDKKNY